MRIRFSLFALLFSVSCGLVAQPVHFTREYIRIIVDDSSCVFTGDYVFTNRATKSVSVSISYPFIVTRNQPFPDSVDVSNHGIPVLFQANQAAVSFPVHIPATDSVLYRVRFQQSLRSPRFEYILTTTQHWKEPLQQSYFDVIVPNNVRITDISLPVQSTQKTTDGLVYHIRQTHFLPAVNLVITWEVNHEKSS